jgi:DNA topoisomerase-3
VKPILANQGKVLAKRVFNNEKVTDHHAIIPTEERVHLSDLSADERKLYELILRRFLAIFHNPYKYETIHASIEVNSETFTARETAVIDLGYRKVERSSDEETGKQSLKNISKGQSFTVQTAELSAKLTEPPLRYSEADILTQMEKYSLGTPATRAEIIERLLDTEAIERQNGRLFPTKKGKQLMDLVNEDLKSPELTAKWEQELEKIARGKADPKEFLQNIRKQTRTLVSEIKKSDKSYRAHNLTGSKCPECDSFLKERNTKDGKILVCSNLDCNFRKRKDPKLSNRRCPQCRKKMEIHQGKAGAYFQCRPCNVVEKAQDKKKAVNKREERKLVQKYTQKEDSFGTSLGDLLKAAMEDKD